MDVGKTRQEKNKKDQHESIWKTPQSTYPRAHSFVFTQLPLLSFENNKSDHEKSQSWAALKVRKEQNSIRDIKRENKGNIIRRVLLGVTVSRVPQNIHHKIHGATSIFLAYTFLEDSFIINFTAGIVGLFYQFNTMGDARVRLCASNRSHTHPTASLQKPSQSSIQRTEDGPQGGTWTLLAARWDPLPDHQGRTISTYRRMSSPFTCIFSIITMLWKKDGWEPTWVWFIFLFSLARPQWYQLRCKRQGMAPLWGCEAAFSGPGFFG